MRKDPDGQSLQSLISQKKDLIDYFYNDTIAPHFRARTSLLSSVIPQEFTNWREEQRAWRETAYFFNQSHHMPAMFLTGRDTHQLLSRLSINNISDFPVGRAKQFIGVTPRGHIIGDCITYRHAEDMFEMVSGMPVLNWVHYQAEASGYDISVSRDAPTAYNTTGRRVRYRFQLEGPNAAQIFNEVVEGGAPEIAFFRTAKVRIRGHEVMVLRHGMSGHLGVELSGPYDELEDVQAAFLEAGEKHEMHQGGLKSYFSTIYESGWMAYPMPGVYTGDELQPYREWLAADSWESNIQLGGSFYGKNIEDYYVSPWDLGYGRLLKFNHDFVGREALEAQSRLPNRTRVTLVWNKEDVLKVFGSQIGDGPRYKSFDFPFANIGWPHYDHVRTHDNRPAGLSTHIGYSANEREVLSLAMIEPDFAATGTELVLTWGEVNGGSRKPHVERHEQIEIRATVAPAPYASIAREKRPAPSIKA